MIRRLGSLIVLMLIAFGTAKAEVLTASVPMTPAGEVPQIADLKADGAGKIIVNITRDAQTGAVTAATIQFLVTFNFPGATRFTGLHIHEGAATVNGPVRFGTDISATNPVDSATGTGFIERTVTVSNLEAFKRFLANPAGFYVNLHTMVNPGGAVRGQMTKLEETHAVTVPMTTAAEVPSVTDEMASGTGTIRIHPVRNPETGAITAATMVFSMTYDLMPNSTITGLHIHENVAGMNGPIFFDTGLNSTTNPLTLPTGKGSLAITVQVRSTSLPALGRLLQNPAGFYVNLHTRTKGGGLIRGQLTQLSFPPTIERSDTYFLQTGSQDASVKLLITGIDLTGSLLINGQPATATPDLATGTVALTVPAALLATPGTLWVQARNGAGLLSNLVGIVVSNNVNSQVATVTDSASFRLKASPEGSASVFGTNLSTETAMAPVVPVPFLLAGTSIFVNGVQAPIFAITPTQLNFLVPPGTALGTASIVVVPKDGPVSRGTANIENSNVAIYTAKRDGTGAPTAVNTADGVVFKLMSDPQGIPVPIKVNTFVVLFGTCFRFASGPPKVTIGGVEATTTFFGMQDRFAGLDQANILVPTSLAGKGPAELVIEVDGKMSNPVQLNIE